MTHMALLSHSELIYIYWIIVKVRRLYDYVALSPMLFTIATIISVNITLVCRTSGFTFLYYIRRMWNDSNKGSVISLTCHGVFPVAQFTLKPQI